MAIDASAAPRQMSLAHEARDATLAEEEATFAQAGAHARSAIDIAVGAVNLAHLFDKTSVFQRAGTGCAIAPSVEASAGNAEVRAHHRDGPGLPVCLDESEDGAFLVETNRTAFFKRSCSI